MELQWHLFPFMVGQQRNFKRSTRKEMAGKGTPQKGLQEPLCCYSTKPFGKHRRTKSGGLSHTINNTRRDVDQTQSPPASSAFCKVGMRATALSKSFPPVIGIQKHPFLRYWRSYLTIMASSHWWNDFIAFQFKIGFIVFSLLSFLHFIVLYSFLWNLQINKWIRSLFLHGFLSSSQAFKVSGHRYALPSRSLALSQPQNCVIALFYWKV